MVAWWLGLGLGAAGGVVLAVLLLLLVRGLVRSAPQGTALVVHKAAQSEVSFGRAIAIPLLHPTELVDIRSQAIRVELRRRGAVRCRDHICADLVVSFHLSVAPEAADVLELARSFGGKQSQAKLEELLRGRFVGALQIVAKGMSFDELDADRELFRQRVVAVVGEDLGGYTLADVAIERVEQTSPDQLDPDDVLDAEGLRQIAERTESERVRKLAATRKARIETAEGELAMEQRLAEIAELRSGLRIGGFVPAGDAPSEERAARIEEVDGRHEEEAELDHEGKSTVVG